MDSRDIKELQQEVMEELGISMEELQEIIDKEVENSEWVRQRKQQLEELEQCMRNKEEEVAHVDQLIDDAMRCVSHSSEEGDVGELCVWRTGNTDNFPHKALNPSCGQFPRLGVARGGAWLSLWNWGGTAGFPPPGPSTSARRWPRSSTP